MILIFKNKQKKNLKILREKRLKKNRQIDNLLLIFSFIG